LNATRSWPKRRLLYGPSGQRDKSYADWLKSHGKVLPDELKV
jgi:hypothetical protein